MDLNRLKELEKLAGLLLDPDERKKLLSDLVELENLASLMPEISSEYAEFPDSQNQFHHSLSDLAMDKSQVQDNAPSICDGFFETPANDSKSGEESP